MMRVLVIVLFVLVMYGNSNAQSGMVEDTVTLNATPLSLAELLKQIENQLHLHFSFDSKSISSDMQLNLPSGRISLKEVLDHLKREHQISYQEHQNVIILKKIPSKKATNKTLSGVVQDEVTGELIIGVQFILVKANHGVTSNAYGFYCISNMLGADEIVRIQSLGYASKEFNFSFLRDSTANIVLSPSAINLKEVTINANTTGPSEIEYDQGAFVMSASNIKAIATFAGEPDPLKALQFLPGVISSAEGTTSLSIRGGSNDQNLFLLDEAPVYNPSHALSFFSIFNPDAIQSVSLHKSEIPVTYGGRLSSVVNVRTKEGNRNALSFSGAVGTIASRLTIEGPLVKKHKKISFLASGRYCYAGSVVNGIYFLGARFGDPTANQSTTNNVIDFYDFNAKINFRKDDRNHFYLSVYNGHDNFYFNHITNGYSMSWGNSTATLRWNHVYNSRLFSNTTALYSNYNYQYRILDNTRYFSWEARFQEFDLKQDYDFYVNNNIKVIFGGGIEGHWINPGEVKPRSEAAVTRTFALNQQAPIGTYVYAGNIWKLTEKWTIQYGLRYSNFILIGPETRYLFEEGTDTPSDSITYGKGETEKIYHRLEPRASINYLFGKNSFSIAYDRTMQYFHFLANSSVGLPTDIWLPSGGTIRPQSADIYSLSYQRSIGETLKGITSAFYKQMNSITDFKDNANLFVNPYMESQLLQGDGTSFGWEFFLQKTKGKFTGLISYTLSKTYYQIDGVNNNEKYSPRHDKTHNLSTSLKLECSKRWEFGANYVYTTGGAITVPSGNFVFEEIAFNTYTTRSGFRLPDYHRLDLSIRFTPKKNQNRKFKSYWVLDIYNAYAKKNPFTVYSRPKDYGFVRADVSAVYLFKILPSLSYNFKF
jgi:hypothetical protein